MRRVERRAQLLRLLCERRELAGCTAEFRASQLAREVGISAVWFYVLVGEEFKRLRTELANGPSSEEDSVEGLRREVGQLRAQLRREKKKYADRLRSKLAAAIGHIELLDRENRMLREKIVALEGRLSEEVELVD
jgi:FtsZ-binding cell division protein ZapB